MACRGSGGDEPDDEHERRGAADLERFDHRRPSRCGRIDWIARTIRDAQDYREHALDNTEQTNATLAALRAMGARICIDDFGTGYSSLLYLQRFPIDEIKVDRSFVSSGGSDALASRPIVEMLTTLARVLDLSLVVEGIETREQLGELLALGCERGQGYLLSKPVPATLAAPARLRSANV